jgi:hypothetical protein
LGSKAVAANFAIAFASERLKKSIEGTGNPLVGAAGVAGKTGDGMPMNIVRTLVQPERPITILRIAIPDSARIGMRAALQTCPADNRRCPQWVA